ncbi:MAG: hypothetical protein QOF37_1332 [Thermoleophilaceae bacterium]|jgi:hypothetical protein|nr:hypothetical protein [Thermoleophilaceae bacterium]
MRSERGQATIEWTGVVLLVALALAAAVAFVPAIDGRSFGSWLAHSILCATRGGCGSGNDALRAAYGADDAALVRRFAPNIVYEPGTHTLPVDFRRCQSHLCSDAPDDPSLEVARSTRTGTPAAAFTHVVRSGGETFLQYWLYYPDSPSTFLGSHAVLKYLPGGDPADHKHDWESYQVRVGPSGDAMVRASSHHGYQGCKEFQCQNQWIGWTGWTRVSKGSHAGHIPYRTNWAVQRNRRRGPPARSVTSYEPLLPGRDLHERTTSAASLELIPIESLDRGEIGTDFGEISPPWRKEVYIDPLSDSTS